MQLLLLSLKIVNLRQFQWDMLLAIRNPIESAYWGGLYSNTLEFLNRID